MREVLGIGLAVTGEADPTDQLQVAQAATRTLDVRAEQEDGLAILLALLAPRLLDALDQLADFDKFRDLLWLPVVLPEHVSLIVSTPPGDCLAAL